MNTTNPYPYMVFNPRKKKTVHMNMGHGGFEYTWFMNPKPPAYWDAVFLEHGYMRVEANATNIHIIVRTPTPPPRCRSTMCDMMQFDVT